MAIPNAYAQYNSSKVMTAKPGELTLMLYDGFIRFCNMSIIAMENKDIEGAHNNLIKCQKIIDYLRQTLDFKYPVAQDFENIYVYVHQRLIQANVKKDPTIAEECRTHMSELRDTWKKVMEESKKGQAC